MTRGRRCPAALALVCASLAWTPVRHDPAPSIPFDPPHREAPLDRRTVAKGTFDVELTPQPASGDLGRMRIDKRIHGDLEATSEGEMLSWLDEAAGAGVYVAIERVTGTLHGRSGSFVLAHRGTMAGGEQQLTITVVPESGTGELTGLSGSMTIRITEGAHFYELEYELPG